MKVILAIILICLCLSQASAQTGQLQPGQTFGNPNASQGFSVPATIPQLLTQSGFATVSQYLAGTANLVIAPSIAYTSETTTTFGTTTAFDFSTFINTAVTLTGNITTMNVTNIKAGQAGQIRFIQDGSGSRTTVWNSSFKFAGGVAPVLSTAINAVDVLFYSCVSTSVCYASLVQNMK
jgi:hypothetical protein